MKTHRIMLITTILLIFLSLLGPNQTVSAQTPAPVVHAVLFFSPGCGHCQLVINEVLLPLLEQYGEQLQMIWFDVSQAAGLAYHWVGQERIQVTGVQPDGVTLYYAAQEFFRPEFTGVPFLIIGDTYYIGSADIPAYFPGEVESYLALGGVDWPAIPGLADYLTAYQNMPTALPSPSLEATETPSNNPVLPARTPTLTLGISTPTPTTPIFIINTHPTSLGERLARDPAGNTLAIIVLAGMLAAVGWGFWCFLRKPGRRMEGIRLWAIPVLSILGLIVAGYLAYVETLQVEAFCGPVGDCNTVQQSPYAYLFGILPIGVLGMVGYLAILTAWAVRLLPESRLTDLATLALFAMTTFGTLFSIYLTFLEPFVIGATCAWCLTASIIMTTLMLFTIPPAKMAFEELFGVSLPPSK